MRRPQKAGGRRGRPSARDRIVDAALELIGEIGVPTVTLDGVAARAGVSKGGLLYHFKFKDELLTAANEHLVRKRVAARDAEAESMQDGDGRELKGYILASVKDGSGTDRIAANLLVAGALTVESAEPFRRYFKDRFPLLAVKVGFDRAALLHAATEGLWFMDALGLSPFTAKERAKLITNMLSIADGADPLGATASKSNSTRVSTRRKKNVGDD